MAEEVVEQAGNEAVGEQNEKVVGEQQERPNPDTQQVKSEDKDARDRAGLIADLQRERAARQQLQRKWEQDQATVKAREEERERIIAAVTGAKSPSPQDAEQNAIREQFKKLFPRETLLEMAGINPDQLSKLDKLDEQMAILQETTQHHWTGHVDRLVETAVKKISEAYGGELSKRQQRVLQLALTDEVSNNPEALRRFTVGDKTYIDEYAKNWLDDWYEPAKRKVTQQAMAGNRRIPDGRGRSPITGPGQKPIDLKDDKAVADFLVKGFKERGGNFGR